VGGPARMADSVIAINRIEAECVFEIAQLT